MKVKFDDWGGRRFLLAISVLAVDTILLALGMVDGTIWRDVLLGTVGVYVAGNVAQKAVERRTSQQGEADE